jgi:hypothetical protein
MFASGCFCDGKFAMVTVVLSASYQKSLGLWDFLLEKGLPVGDEEAVAVGAISEDSPANEGLLPMCFYILLNDDYIVT